VLTDALMPPWAQTECERFTGTSENKEDRDVGFAESDDGHQAARPPPMTITRRTAPDDVRTMFLVATISSYADPKLQGTGVNEG